MVGQHRVDATGVAVTVAEADEASEADDRTATPLHRISACALGVAALATLLLVVLIMLVSSDDVVLR